MSVTIAIPTYRRPQLLKLLIEDLMQQTRHPDNLIIVDGDQEYATVREMLHTLDFPATWNVSYIPSNHGNAAYQRYLATLAQPAPDILVYMDDDLRIPETKMLENLLAPFAWDSEPVMGVTSDIIFPKQAPPPPYTGDPARAGGLTPSGHRIPPMRDGEYAETKWLRGGVMAFRSEAIQDNPYYADIFALGHIRCGLGVDDTFISYWASQHGRMLLAFNAPVHHPDADSSQAYPAKGHGLGYARAYSRRFINDHYRFSDSPTVADRLALLRSYFATNIINWLNVLRSQNKRYQAAYAWGYSKGVLHAAIRAPRADNLTPDIDWFADAKAAIKQLETIHPR